MASIEDLRLRRNILCLSNRDPDGDTTAVLVRTYDPVVEIRYKDPKKYERVLPCLVTPLSRFEGLEDIKAFIAAEEMCPIVKDYLAKHGR